MRKTKHNIISTIASIALLILFTSTAWAGQPEDDIFIVKTTSLSMDEVVTAVKAFSKKKKWVFLAADKVKKGEVILVKFCVKAAGKLAFKAGYKVSALFPCGSMGVYKNNGKTEISLLNPKYMNILYPNPNLKAAGDLVAPLFKELMDTL